MFDIRSIWELTGAAKAQKIVRNANEEVWAVPWDIDLEDLARSYTEQDQKILTDKLNKPATKPQTTPWTTITVYTDAGAFYDIPWFEYKVVDVAKLRNELVIEVWDSFVWDKVLVRWLGKIEYVDKIWDVELIEDYDKDYINDIETDQFKKYFNPLTYIKWSNVDLDA